jgi:hypothetical protein
VKITTDMDDLHPGHELAEPVQKDGSILFESGYELTLEDIVLLKVWRISEVSVEIKPRGRSAA